MCVDAVFVVAKRIETVGEDDGGRAGRDAARPQPFPSSSISTSASLFA